jgi:hypothetical protein
MIQRKRKPDIVIIAAGLALAAIVVILAGGGGNKDIWPVSFPGQSPSRPEVTFRNVTDRAIHYKIRFSQPKSREEERTLEPDGLDRIRTKRPVEIIYQGGDKTLFFIASPGKPYSFRYNEDEEVRIYPGSHSRRDAADLAPYVQTPMPVVEKMLELAELGPGDLLYDIGSGDGRIVIAAAKRYGVQAVGIEINPALIEESRTRALEEGVDGLVRFVCMDAMKADFTEATAVTLYLLPESNSLLKPKLERELQQGARVVSHNYLMRDWQDRMIGMAKVKDDQGKEHNVLAYRR